MDKTQYTDPETEALHKHHFVMEGTYERRYKEPTQIGSWVRCYHLLVCDCGETKQVDA